MIELPANSCVEQRNQGYYMAGTRISLDSIAYGVIRGQSVEEIIEDFPAIESREELAGVVAYVNANRSEVEAYLAVQAQRWEEAAKANRPELTERLRRFAEERARKLA